MAENWVTDLNIAAGAKDTDVHKAKVRITITPAVAGVSLTAINSGGGGDVIPCVCSPTTSLTTDSDGRVFGDYTSSDKVEDATIKVTYLAGSSVDIDLGSTLRHVWDDAGEYDFDYPVYFVPGEPDNVTFYPTLEVSGGAGAIGGHAIGYYTPSITLLVCQYDCLIDLYSEDLIEAEYPSYSGIPTGFSVDDFIEHSATTETPSGVYVNTQTVYDYWDYDPITGDWWEILVEGYDFGAYDLDVCWVP